MNSGTGGPPVSGEPAHGPAAHATFDSGTGGPPVVVVGTSTPDHGRAAHATEESALQIRQGAYLPHWTLAIGGIYAVTYRLADSLPRLVLEGFLRERDALAASQAQRDEQLTQEEEQRLAHLHSERIEAYLDAGNGSCWLRQPEIATCVVGNLQYFNGTRYRLHAWCIMPNHVHVLVEPLPGHTLRELVHSWKSYTAKSANRILCRSGDFWQPEYYDHLIRDDADYRHAVRYIEQNPWKAGFIDWRWVSCGTGGPPVESHEHGRAARATEQA